jgi:hypothetical protein
MLCRASDLDRFFAVSKEWKMDMSFGTGNARSPYRSGSLKTVAREL